MSIFGSIMNKIFHGSGSGAVSPQPTSVSGARPSAPPPSSTSTSTPSEAVDVAAVLTQIASHKSGGGNWKTSVVDLLKLLDLDSSLDARKQLANELNVHAGADGSAEQNIALHKAVMRKLAENGGKVPDSLKS
ncbi:MAG: DUF3597 domain-containing protein [Alphaproteobacteria bacterium]|nr:DUF3597 domain-containing protein [Alphaproteobacteria bacterium]